MPKEMQLAIAEGDGASCVRAFNTAQEQQIEESGGRQGLGQSGAENPLDISRKRPRPLTSVFFL